MTTTAVVGVAAAAFGAWNYYSNTPNPVEEEWVAMPDGKLYHTSCIHHHEDNFRVDRLMTGSLLSKTNGEGHMEQTWLPPCPYKPRMQEVEKKDENNLGYYSDWSVYAQWLNQSSSILRCPVSGLFHQLQSIQVQQECQASTFSTDLKMEVVITEIPL